MENNLEDIQRKSAVGVSNNITLRSEVINDNEKQANDDNPPLFWEKFFIREEFLKLYFQNLGINNNLKISRLTNIYDIKRKESNEKFLFAIIRYNITDEHLLEEGIKTDYEKIHKERLNLFV
jgi:ankyrin repeat protein